MKKAHKKVCGVQVGAFSRYAPAHLAASSTARRLPSLLRNAKMVVLPKKEEVGIIYRARLIGLNETVARHIYEELKKNNFSCIAVPLGSRVSAGQSEAVGAATNKQPARK